MKTQSAKSKGRRLQQKVASDLLHHYPQLEPDDVRSTSMGCGGEDVQLSPAARQVFPYSVECKNVERLNIWSALDQATANCGDATPIVIFRRNRSATYAVVPWDHFLQLQAHTPTDDALTPPTPQQLTGVKRKLDELVQEVADLMESHA